MAGLVRVGLWGPLGKGVFLFWESAVVSGVSCVALWGHWVYVCVCVCYAVGRQRSLGGCVCAASLSYVGWEGGWGAYPGAACFGASFVGN